MLDFIRGQLDHDRVTETFRHSNCVIRTADEHIGHDGNAMFREQC